MNMLPIIRPAEHAPSHKFSDQQLQEMGYVAARLLANGTWVGVCPMTFGKGRLCVELDHFGYADGYCYSSLSGAIEAMQALDDNLEEEPQGWMRHPQSGRRREGGDPAKEVVWD